MCKYLPCSVKSAFWMTYHIVSHPFTRSYWVVQVLNDEQRKAIERQWEREEEERERQHELDLIGAAMARLRARRAR